MKLTLVMVSSLNGRITKGDANVLQDWASKEDQRYFYSLLKRSRLIIMGAKTFEVSRKGRVLTKKTLRVVITRNTQKYSKETVSGQLEFSSETPKKLISRLKKLGYSEGLIIGGGELNKSFFEAGLITEFLLTVEPIIFGRGKLLISDGSFYPKLKLLSVKKLNALGTLLLRYQVV